MENKVLVSVVVAVYNAKAYLKECIDSLISQTLKDIEIICVNDGSNDNSLSILEEYAKNDNRIKLLSQVNQGAGAARDNGYKYAKGKYIIFLDSDDIFSTEMLEKMYKSAEENGSDVVVCNSYSFVGTVENAKKQYGINYNIIKDNKTFCPKDYPNSLFQIFVPWVWDKLIRKSFIDNFYTESSKYRILEDHLISFPVIVHADIISIVDDYLVFYRKNFNGITMSNGNINIQLKGIFAEVKNIISQNNCFEFYKQSYYKYMLFYISRYIEKPYSFKYKCKQYKHLREIVLTDLDLEMIDTSECTKGQKKQIRTCKKIKLFPNWFLFSLFSKRYFFSIKSYYEKFKIITILGFHFKRRING